MPGGPVPIETPAQFLARWVRPSSLGDFEACYLQVCPAGEAPSWAELVATAGEALVAEACAEAAKGGFLDRLAERVAERERAAGRVPKEIRQMLAKTKPKRRREMGELHAVLDQDTGLMDETAVFAVAEALRACAMVYHGTKFKGTAFLVRSDMVLTAAHVVLGSEQSAGKETWSRGLADELSFSFRARANRPVTERVPILPAAKDALRKFSLPFGEYPKTLFPDLAPPAKPSFDYALVQLAQRVDHVDPIGVDPPSAVEKGSKCWAIGFPGGTALKLDVDRVIDDTIGGGRWIHLANAASGMSGGCCINHLGKLAGVHEGSVELDRGGGFKRYNRGVGIAAIRQDQLLGGRDPMAARTATPGVGFDDPEMVANLWRAGAQLSSPQTAWLWDASMRAAFPAGDPGDLASLPGFHPWFERRDFKDWIGSDKKRERLCLISGDRGAGATFCKQILRTSLNSGGLGYFEVSPTQVAAFSPAEAIGVTTAPSANRTGAASFRYNDASELIAQMRPADGSTQGTLSIDFGPDGGPDRLIGSSWQEFIARLLAEEWIRVVLIGLRPPERNLLRDGLSARQEIGILTPREINLAPISPEDFEAYAMDVCDARGVQLSATDLRERIAAIVGPAANAAAAPALQTAKFALAAIALERGLPRP